MWILCFSHFRILRPISGRRLSHFNFGTHWTFRFLGPSLSPFVISPEVLLFSFFPPFWWRHVLPYFFAAEEERRRSPEDELPSPPNRPSLISPFPNQTLFVEQKFLKPFLFLHCPLTFLGLRPCYESFSIDQPLFPSPLSPFISLSSFFDQLPPLRR